ncbi:heavy metal translocating P-type ATPase [Halorarius halobius]|uniref:heavy metal translocating P-type ATPase n=1 Tax=Halorarius halobius TaxID=2962671 RepID=UPI0020CFCDE5|nr:cation-translocating P-type ATPase [Halorarius halobius]
MTRTDDGCSLCSLPTPDPPVTGEETDGAYCCRGCLEVARTLGPEADGEGRETLETGADPDDADGETAYLAVDGMHCSTCEAFLESRATDHAGVEAAAASYATGLVRLVYDPERLDADALPGVLSGTGYRARAAAADPADDESLGRLLVGLFFGMMTMLWYVLFLYPAYLGLPPSLRLFALEGTAGGYLLWNVAAFAGVVLAYTGYPLLRGAYVSLRAGRPNMDLLVALAATTAFVYSTAVLVTGGTEVYYDVSVAVVLVVTVGNHYEGRVRERATGRLTDLTEERADRARRRTGEGTEQVSVDDLTAGDELVVRSGERVPTDGTVVEGTAGVDRSLVTGESRPVRRTEGDEVVGGALVTDGGLVVAVDDGAESTLDRLVSLLWEVQATRPGAQRLADRLAAVFVPLVVALAVATFGVHLWLGASPTGAVLTALAVLVVSCPCALGLATPLAVAAGVRESLARGVVVADGSVFERAPDVDVVALDKTGTLTTGKMQVHEVTTVGPDRATLLSRAAAVEQFAEHPVAGAVVDAAPATTASVEEFETHPGRGVSASVDGDQVVVGSSTLFEARDWEVPASLASRAVNATESGRVPALVGWDGRARGVVVAGDEPRPGWRAVVSRLATDRRVVVLSGDSEAATGAFLAHPDVDEAFAGVPPEAKAQVIRRLGRDDRVAMVGDGSNDAPALATADLGIALESGTRLAADAADVVVTGGDLRAVPTVFSLTAATRRRVRENLGWAFLYNAVAVPLAVGGLINPLFAAVAMATSSLLVVGNSARSVADDAATESEETTPDPPSTAAEAGGVPQ